MTTTLSEIQTLINKLNSHNEIKILFKMGNARFKSLEAIKANEYNPGDRVVWENRRTGELITGTVLRINKTTVSVDCGSKGRWKVSAGFLTLASEGKSTTYLVGDSVQAKWSDGVYYPAVVSHVKGSRVRVTFTEDQETLVVSASDIKPLLRKVG